MPTLDFSQQLLEAKRKANLRGRPLSRQEIESVTSGVAEGAHMRNVTGEQLQLREEGLDLQAESLAEAKRVNTASLAEARKTRHQQESADKMGMYVAGGALLFEEPLSEAGSAVSSFIKGAASDVWKMIWGW